MPVVKEGDKRYWKPELVYVDVPEVERKYFIALARECEGTAYMIDTECDLRYVLCVSFIEERRIDGVKESYLENGIGLISKKNAQEYGNGDAMVHENHYTWTEPQCVNQRINMLLRKIEDMSNNALKMKTKEMMREYNIPEEFWILVETKDLENLRNHEVSKERLGGEVKFLPEIEQLLEMARQLQDSQIIRQRFMRMKSRGNDNMARAIISHNTSDLLKPAMSKIKQEDRLTHEAQVSEPVAGASAGPGQG